MVTKETIIIMSNSAGIPMYKMTTSDLYVKRLSSGPCVILCEDNVEQQHIETGFSVEERDATEDEVRYVIQATDQISAALTSLSM